MVCDASAMLSGFAGYKPSKPIALPQLLLRPFSCECLSIMSSTFPRLLCVT